MWPLLSVSLTLSLAVTSPRIHVGSAAVAHHSPKASEPDAKQILQQYRDLKNYVQENFLTDPGVMARIGAAQIWAASLNDTIPKYSAFPFMLSPQEDTLYQYITCFRAKISECMSRGNSTNSLPKAVQGIWWPDGDWLDAEALSTAGEWDEKTRTLKIDLWQPGTWAAHATSSARVDALWLPSGAAFLNWLSSWRPQLTARFNEDMSFTRITIGGILLYIFPFHIPQYVWGSELSQLDDGSWSRKSKLLGLAVPSASYVLRPIINGKGKPAQFFDQWADLYGGRPITTLVEAEKGPMWYRGDHVLCGAGDPGWSNAGVAAVVDDAIDGPHLS